MSLAILGHAHRVVHCIWVKSINLTTHLNLNYLARGVIAIGRDNINAGGLIVIPGWLGNELMAPVGVEHSRVLRVMICERISNQKALVI